MRPKAEWAIDSQSRYDTHKGDLRKIRHSGERSERVRYCSCHENIKFISSSRRVMFFLLYGDYILKISDFIVFQSSQVLQIRLGFIKKAGKKGGNRDVIGDIQKIRHSGPG